MFTLSSRVGLFVSCNRLKVKVKTKKENWTKSPAAVSGVLWLCWLLLDRILPDNSDSYWWIRSVVFTLFAASIRNESDNTFVYFKSPQLSYVNVCVVMQGMKIFYPKILCLSRPILTSFVLLLLFLIYIVSIRCSTLTLFLKKKQTNKTKTQYPNIAHLLIKIYLKISWFWCIWSWWN